LQKWQQIEDKINELLEKAISKSGDMVAKKTPKRLKKSTGEPKPSLKDKIQKNSLALKTKVVENSKKTIVKAKELKSNSQEFVKKAKSESLSEIKEKGLIVALIAFATPTVIKIKQWFASLESTTIVGFVTVSTVVTLTGLNIYKQSKKIADEKAAQAELVEKVENARAISSRPGYHKKQERTFIVYDIVLPAYFEKNKISKLVIDFSIESSNKYIKAFFLENPHYVNDVLNSKIEPISVDFPLEQEGKIIVKDKIRDELNILLKSLKIEGEITEVNIHKIVGG
jgi:hypothetical protein